MFDFYDNLFYTVVKLNYKIVSSIQVGNSVRRQEWNTITEYLIVLVILVSN
jgi:hypothetical protein